MLREDFQFTTPARQSVRFADILGYAADMWKQDLLCHLALVSSPFVAGQFAAGIGALGQ